MNPDTVAHMKGCNSLPKLFAAANGQRMVTRRLQVKARELQASTTEGHRCRQVVADWERTLRRRSELTWEAQTLF